MLDDLAERLPEYLFLQHSPNDGSARWMKSPGCIRCRCRNDCAFEEPISSCLKETAQYVTIPISNQSDETMRLGRSASSNQAGFLMVFVADSKYDAVRGVLCEWKRS